MTSKMVLGVFGSSLVKFSGFCLGGGGRWVHEIGCDVFPCKGISGGLGLWNPKSTICPFRARKWPFQAPKALRFKGKMANFEAKNVIPE